MLKPTKSSMECVAADLSMGLLGELECPVCMEYMLPPITFCLNGHNICNNCKPMLTNCPTCRQPFVNIRNVALEKLARQMKYPCTFRYVLSAPSITSYLHLQLNLMSVRKILS